MADKNKAQEMGVEVVQATPEEPKLKTTSQRMAEKLEEEPIDYNGIMIELTTSGKRPISQSAAKAFLDSPMALYNYYFGDQKESTPQMILGKAYEIMLMEPDKVDEQIVVSPKFNRRTNAGREAYAEFQAKWKGKIILPEDQMEICLAMYQRARRDDEVMEILEGVAGVQEEIYYTHRTTGLRCVAKIDFRTPMDNKPFKVIDLKTLGGTANPNNWQRQVNNFKYWFQGGSYFNSFRHKYYLFPDFYWLVAETSPPYDLNYFKADAELIREGERIWELVLQGINYCNENKTWDLGHKFWRLMSNHDTIRLPGYFVMR